MSPHKVVILFEIAVTEVVNHAGVLCRLQLRQPYVAIAGLKQPVHPA